jgi:thiol-disulfide isomerase/thioredoxin
MPKEQVVYYYSKDCPHCKDFTPLLKKMANSTGVKVKKVDVNDCPKGDYLCPLIPAVPAVFHNGIEIPFNPKGMPDKLREIGKKK